METTLTPIRRTPPAQPAEKDGALVRKGVIAIGTVCSMLVAALILVAPELVYFVPLWFLWVLVMVPVIAGYVSGNILRRRALGRPSRRMRRWIATREG